MDMETPRARRLKRKADHVAIVLSDSDNPLVSSPAKRLRRKSRTESPQTPRAKPDKDQEEIDEDVKDLQDSGMSFGSLRVSCNMLIGCLQS